MRRGLILLVVLAVAVAAVALYAFAEARRDPVVRRITVRLPRWPAGAPPLRVALLSDLHVGTASTSVARLARVVAQVNAEHPDLVLIAGDLLPGHDPIAASRVAAVLAPLGGLHARLGVVGVPGNHDHWTAPKAIPPIVARLGVTWLANQSIVRGPLAIGGVDDDYTHHDLLPRVETQVRRLPGARVILTHSPDIAVEMAADMPLLLAGHTHCAQVLLPVIGQVVHVNSRPRYRCGAVRDPTRLVIVGAGIGTSGVPFRLNAPPDWWLLTLGP